MFDWVLYTSAPCRESRKKLSYMKNLEIFWRLFMNGVKLSRVQSHYEEIVYFLPLDPREFLVLI